jgi:hypothetical protein
MRFLNLTILAILTNIYGSCTTVAPEMKPCSLDKKKYGVYRPIMLKTPTYGGISGDPHRNRTYNLLIKSPTCFRLLSYMGSIESWQWHIRGF